MTTRSSKMEIVNKIDENVNKISFTDLALLQIS